MSNPQTTYQTYSKLTKAAPRRQLVESLITTRIQRTTTMGLIVGASEDLASGGDSSNVMRWGGGDHDTTTGERIVETGGAGELARDRTLHQMGTPLRADCWLVRYLLMQMQMVLPP